MRIACQLCTFYAVLSKVILPNTMQALLDSFLTLLALPQYSLSTVFIVSLISATLLPLGSEPVVFGLISLNPDLFWQVIAVATLGNTLGGAIDWWLGYGAHTAMDKYKNSPTHLKALVWLERFGPKTCLLAWLPIVGDPLCAVAGWLRFPFWPCVAYMLVGKFLRYLTMTTVLIWFFPK
jgi:membrane protein YqaA with SNARE-associated domain